jgi:hypothetical protein
MKDEHEALVEGAAKTLYCQDWRWIETAKERMWQELPEDDEPSGYTKEDGEPIIITGKNHYRSRARAVLAFIAEKLQTVTPEMITAWMDRDDIEEPTRSPEFNEAAADWRAMLAASPLTPAPPA